MAEFVWLRYGDRLPAVACAQALLNRTGASLKVDGIFGGGTKAAVKRFQHDRKDLGVDGIIGKNTWPRLVASERLPIADCIDVFDFAMFESEVEPLQNAGGRPIVIGGMSNGIEQAVSQILAQMSGKIFLLRFHGHGASGSAGMSSGTGSLHSDNSTDFGDNPATKAALGKLKSKFSEWGSIQFMHCSTGAGPQGQRFLGSVAETVAVPATAAHRTQYSGDLRTTVRYEGPTRTVCPGGKSLQAWSAARPAFAGMSVV